MGRVTIRLERKLRVRTVYVYEPFDSRRAPHQANANCANLHPPKPPSGHEALSEQPQTAPPCRRPLRSERAALALWARRMYASSMVESTADDHLTVDGDANVCHRR